MGIQNILRVLRLITGWGDISVECDSIGMPRQSNTNLTAAWPAEQIPGHCKLNRETLSFIYLLW